MAGGIKGLTVEIDGNTTKLGTALNSAEKQAKSCSKELKQINEQLKLDPSNVQLAAQKQQVLTEAIAATEKKLKAMNAARQDVKAKLDSNEISAEEYRAFERELARTEARLKSLKKQAEGESKAVQEAGQSAEKAGKQSNAASKDVEKLGDAMDKAKAGAEKLAAVALSGLTALSGATVAVAKETIEAYAEYEQLVGGVETLFKDSAETVKGYAENAYKTAGMSANRYMETVTGFSASLLQSLNGDTKKTAEKANLAITDMSDNANKMGSDISAIQAAYQGFAKQTYTMLDNLKLGYGGTKQEMERLLADAEKLSGIKYSISSYSDIIDAIHVIQTELGITGTTALEASTTILGSWEAVKASAQNFAAGFTDETKDMDMLLQNLEDSTNTFVDNVAPRLEQFFARFGVKINGDKLKKDISKVFNYVTQTAIPGVIRGLDWIVSNAGAIKRIIVSIGTAIAATKAARTIATTISSIRRMITALKTAKTAQEGLNVAMSSNVIGLVAAAIGVLVGVITQFVQKAADAKAAQEELNQAYRDAADAAMQSAQKQRDAAKLINNEFDIYEDLWNCLQKMVDENGRVKECYQDRVDFITKELSEATGEEITQIDGVIDKYGELIEQMDTLLQKKRAEKLMGQMEGAYDEAVDVVNSTEKDSDGNYILGSHAAVEAANATYQSLKTTHDSYDSQKTQLELEYSNAIAAQEQLNREISDLAMDYQSGIITRKEYDSAIKIISDQINAQIRAEDSAENALYELDKNYVSQEQVDAAKKNLENAQYAYDANVSAIEKYESLETAVLTGSADDLAAAITEASDNLMTAHDASLSSLVKQQEAADSAYSQLVEWSQTEGSTVTSEQLADAFNLRCKSMLETYSKMMQDGSGATDEEIANQEALLREALEEAGQYTTEEIDSIIQKAADGAVDLGENYGEGFAQGIENAIPRVNRAAKLLADSVDKSVSVTLQIFSPSRVARKKGGYYGEGFALGIEDEEENAAAQAARLAQRVNAAISGELTLPAVKMANEEIHISARQAQSEAIAGGLADLSYIYSKLDSILRAVRDIDPTVYMDGERIAEHLSPYSDRNLGKYAADSNRGRLA